jgi:hypothetical protein
MRRAGLKKHFVTIMDDDNKPVKFCYCEKGIKVPQQPSIIFIHGFSSDKHTWSKMIKVGQYLYYCRKNKHCFFLLFIDSMFLIIIIVSLLICHVMGKLWDLILKT